MRSPRSASITGLLRGLRGLVHLHRPRGVAEFTHFIFPLLRPALDPTLTAAITAQVSTGRVVADMPNYWIGATGRYYFPGLYTAVLPMIPGIYAIVRLARARTRSMDDRVQSVEAKWRTS